jgi:UDP-galactopyranose mutase
VGRLATYKYYNMDQVVAQALAVYRKVLMPQLQAAIVQEPAASFAALVKRTPAPSLPASLTTIESIDTTSAGAQ